MSVFLHYLYLSKDPKYLVSVYTYTIPDCRDHTCTHARGIRILVHVLTLRLLKWCVYVLGGVEVHFQQEYTLTLAFGTTMYL